MRLKITSLITVLVIGLVGSGLAMAESTITPVTSNTYEDTFPQISGNYLVWQGHGNLPGAVYGSDDWEVFVCNIATGVTTQITDNDNDDDLNPRTDGRYVVWWSDKATGAEVWLYDTVTGGKTQISPVPGADENHYLPVIANGRVAWLGFIRGEVIQRDIWLYDISEGTPEQLTDSNLDESSLRISDEQLMWVQTDEEGNTIVYIHDFGTGATGPAPDDFVWSDSPQEDGNLRVSMSRDEQDWEIIIRDSDIKRLEQITDNAIDDRYPRISGNKVAWMAGEGQTREIFLAEYIPIEVVLLSPPDGVVLPKKEIPTFTWRSVGYSEFKVQFSHDEGFPGLSTITFPETASVWLSDLFFTPDKSQWRPIEQMGRRHGSVYWRVEGKHADGTVAFTGPWDFTIPQGKGKHAETTSGIGQSIAAVIGTGSDGEGGVCFIDTVKDSL